MRGATAPPPCVGTPQQISIHAPHAGRDRSELRHSQRAKYFNPRAPCGARPLYTYFFAPIVLFQSTRPMRGATGNSEPVGPETVISIHAPHAGRDPPAVSARSRTMDFNPRAPCGARPAMTTRRLRSPDFNPRAPCGARPQPTVRTFSESEFQSTRPMRGATRFTCIIGSGPRISIHAPHAGRDWVQDQNGNLPDNFNPRAPCGARHETETNTKEQKAISIHAPHAGRDAEA